LGTGERRCRHDHGGNGISSRLVKNHGTVISQICFFHEFLEEPKSPRPIPLIATATLNRTPATPVPSPTFPVIIVEPVG